LDNLEKRGKSERSVIRSRSLARPDWIRVRAVGAETQRSMAEALKGCNTVCLSAKCPNLGECFGRGVATFMIGGSVCTRACRFCGVRHGKPQPLDPTEPDKVAESVAKLKLKYVVVTGVARDDLMDGGAGHYAATVRAVRAMNPGTGIEVLIPDFGGSEDALRTVIDAGPTIVNHNVETVRRLTPSVRSKATYERSLGVLSASGRLALGIPTKSGMMVGLGETREEVLETLKDIIAAGCRLVTIGQYLQPRAGHELPVSRYWSPEEFEDLREEARAMGFIGVAASPFVRSSYFAEQLAGVEYPPIPDALKW
jgi:lipoic acid synthetase